MSSLFTALVYLSFTLAQNTAIPSQAQQIHPVSFAVLPTVPPPSQANGTSLFIPPNSTVSSLSARPFLVYDPDFLPVIGSNPTLTLIAESESDPLFHEAVTWYPPTDEVSHAERLLVALII